MLDTNELLQGRYKITRKLGQGGMGAVYEAEDAKQFGKIVALKEILTTLTNVSDVKQHELFRSAFEREAKILMQVDHEAFPQVIDYFSEGNRQFLVMQLIQGKDLNELLIKNQGAFPIEQVCGWADQLLDALDYLHTLKPPIIHRDIKPQNLKLTSRGKVKLLDFGIAKGVDKKSSVTITNATMVAATLHYSPSEQLLRVIDPITREALQMIYGEKMERLLEQNADLRSDIYSLAATLYHFLTNKAPVDSLKRTIEFWRENPDNLIPPNKLNPEIPDDISDWLIKAMAINREERFPSALEMRHALHKAIAGKNQREEEIKKQSWAIEQEKLRIEREKLEIERREIEKQKFEHQRQVELERQRRAALENQHPHDAPTIANLPPEHPAAPNLGLTQPAIVPPAAPPIINDETPVKAENTKHEATALSYLGNLKADNENSRGQRNTGEFPYFNKIEEVKSEQSAPAYAPQTVREEQRAHVTANSAAFNNNVKWLIPLAALAIFFLGTIAVGMWIFLGTNSNKSAETNSSDSGTLTNTKSSAPIKAEPSPSPDAGDSTINVSEAPASAPETAPKAAPPKTTVETKNEPTAKTATPKPVQTAEPKPVQVQTPKPVQVKTPKPPPKKKDMNCILTDSCK